MLIVQNAAFGSVIDGYMPTQVAGHTGGSARLGREVRAWRGAGTVTAARPGEWTQIDSTPLDVRVVLDDGPWTGSS